MSTVHYIDIICSMYYIRMLCTLQEYFQTVLEFLKLEKVEFGGTKGRELSEMVVNIFHEFQGVVNKLSHSTYDPLDVHCEVSTMQKWYDELSWCDWYGLYHVRSLLSP